MTNVTDRNQELIDTLMEDGEYRQVAYMLNHCSEGLFSFIAHHRNMEGLVTYISQIGEDELKEVVKVKRVCGLIRSSKTHEDDKDFAQRIDNLKFK